MQARGQIALLVIVATVMSIVRWLKNKRAHHFSWEMHLPLLLTSRKGRCCTARREEPTITMMMKFELNCQVLNP